MSKKFRSIKVRQLIELLKDEDPNALVTFRSDYGDHCHTQQVHALRGEVTEYEIVESGFSDSGWALADPEDEDEVPPDAPSVVVIS